MTTDSRLEQLPLGKPTRYVSTYTPSLLHSVRRAPLRESLGIEEDALPFRGVDQWNGYELSWLNRRGKPEIAAMRMLVPASTPCIIESKSLKLYLNSFSQTTFSSRAEVARTLESDLSLAARAPVSVTLVTLDQLYAEGLGHFAGTCLDQLDIDVSEYRVQPKLLRVNPALNVRESVFSHLLRSNCPVTGQPDWGSILIQYAGPAIDHAGLLRYIVSLREHNGFHEETVERVFMDLQRRCEPTSLTVSACYLRRGGLDICPYRSTEDGSAPSIRLPRQ
jgi:7-cyano-7-deazaguanine reductase